MTTRSTRAHLAAVVLILTLCISMVSMFAFAQETPIVCGEGVVYTVQPGDSLFGIAARVGTTIDMVLSANNIPLDHVIRPGNTLLIPCAPTPTPTIIPPTPMPGFVTITPTRQQIRRAIRRGQPVPVTTTVDCRNFRATSPLDGLANGFNTFYWDAAPGAQSYSVIVFNYDEENGEVVAYGGSSGDTLNATINLSVRETGPGFNFGFRVEAIAVGQVACRTPIYYVNREAPLPRGS